MKQLTATITTGLFMLLPIACTQEYGQEQADNHDITVGFTATAGELAARAEAAVGKSLEAGANVIVSGSAVFRGDIGKNIEKIQKVLSFYTGHNFYSSRTDLPHTFPKYSHV